MYISDDVRRCTSIFSQTVLVDTILNLRDLKYRPDAQDGFTCYNDM